MLYELGPEEEKNLGLVVEKSGLHKVENYTCKYRIHPLVEPAIQ